MLIDIVSGKITSVNLGSIQSHKLNDDGSLFAIIRSPNHPEIPMNESMAFGMDIKSYANYYVNDSICILDNDKKRVLISRDWPGNTMLYYWIGDIKTGKRLIVSDDLEEIAAEVPNVKASKEGIKLFLNNYKHYHCQTIYEGIKILPQGFLLEFDLINGSHIVNPWFKFHRNITTKNPKQAKIDFRTAVDNSIRRTIEKDSEVALMFSGGSDSTLLLDRLIHLGYKNISLFNIETLGQNSRFHRAKVRADSYGLELNCIHIDPSSAYKDWLDIIGKIYSAPSDVRPNGWVLELPHIYEELSKHYDSQPTNIIWGYARGFHAHYLRFRRIPFVFMAHALLRLLPATKGQHLNSIGRFALTLLGKINFLEHNKSTVDQIDAMDKVLFDFVQNIKHPDELINLKMIFGYVHEQEWELHRFQTTSDLYYPEARNVWPFYDRRFQEVSMTMSIRARFGGTMNWFRMYRPESRKSLTLSAIEKDLPKITSAAESLLGGNYLGRTNMKALYKNENCYSAINDLFSQPQAQRILKHLSKEKLFKPPNSFEEFCELSNTEIEMLSGVVLLLAHFTPNGIKYP